MSGAPLVHLDMASPSNDKPCSPQDKFLGLDNACRKRMCVAGTAHVDIRFRWLLTDSADVVVRMLACIPEVYRRTDRWRLMCTSRTCSLSRRRSMSSCSW